MNEREIFAAAMQIASPGERDAFLREACQRDASLRERIEALLAENDKLGSFLEDPLAIQTLPTPGPATIERPGTQIGPYKLLQVLGEGGMGVVYLADQLHPVARRVALKIIKPGMDTRQVIARFEAERQALALMDHPNIAKVLDAGATPSGRPYFVMELVKGMPVTQFCDQQHLPPRERLELFMLVCQAVQHAHQKGIIHRDLKPSNVLIALYDGRPVPKIIDFGLAKATGQRLTQKTMFTEVGSIVGTLEYMAPEQAELNNLDIDTRADIYSLGVILYELLTGSPPFSAKQLRSAGFAEMLRMIREDEPQRPSTKISSSNELPTIAANRQLEPQRLTRLVKGDLDWIVMKCLEKQRERRYDTANGLALELDRYLRDEPVLAGPPSAAYRLRKYLRRNRSLVAAASVVFLALVLGAIGTTAGLVRAAWERSAKETADRNAANSDKLAKAAIRAEGVAKTALARAVTAEREVQIAAHLSQSRAFRASGRPGQRIDCLAELAKAARLDPSPRLRKELRDEAIAALQLTDVKLVREVSAQSSRVWTVFDEQFKCFAQRGANAQMILFRTSDAQEVCRFQHGRLNDPWRFSPDGKWLALNELDEAGQAMTSFHDSATGAEVYRVRGSFNAFHHNGQQAMVWLSGATQAALVYSLDDGRELRRVETGTGGSWPTADPELHQLAVVTGQKVKFWNVETGAVDSEANVPGFRAAFSRHAASQMIAYATQDHRIIVRNARNDSIQMATDSVRGPVTFSQFNRQGDLLAVVGWDELMRVYDAMSGQLLLTIPGGAPEFFAFSLDDRWLGSSYHNQSRRIWEVVKGSDFCRRYSGPYDSQDDSRADFSSDGQVIALSGPNGLALHQARTGRELAVFPFKALPRFSPHDGALWTVGPNGVYRWPYQALPAESGTARLTLGPPERKSEESFVQANFASQAPRLALTSYAKKAVSVASSVDFTQRVDLAVGGGVRSAISPDGRLVATGPSGSEAIPITVWDAHTGERITELKTGASNYSVGVDFSNDNAALATSTIQGLFVWDTATWQRRWFTPRESGAWSGPAAFSPDSRIIAYARSPYEILLLDAGSGEELARLPVPGHHQISGVQLWFSRDGGQLAVSGKGKSTSVWNLRAIREELANLGLDWEETSAVSLPAGNEVVAATLKLGTLAALPPNATPAEKLAYWSEMLDLDPNNVAARIERMQLHEAADHPDLALADGLAGLEAAPQRIQLLAACARIHARLGNNEQSLACTNRLAGIPPSTEVRPLELAAACYELCWHFVTGPQPSRHPQAAIVAGRRSVELQPDSWRFRNALAIAYYRNKQWDDAAREFENCVKGSTGWGTYFYDIYFLTATEHLRGNTDKAQQYLKQAREWETAFAGKLTVADQPLQEAFRTEMEAVLKQPAGNPKS